MLIGIFLAQPAFAADPIHIRTTGSGAHCWVLLHPLSMSGKFWDRRAKLLAEEYKVRVYAPDLPNHGLSGLAPRFSYNLAADSVRAALSPVCPSPRLIIGASSGGIVAMKLAARGSSRVAVVGVGWSFTKDNVRSLEAQSRPNADQEKYLRSYAEEGDAQVKALFKSFQDLAEIGTGPLLTRAERRSLSGRLLIINGSDDAFFRPDNVKRLNHRIRGSELNILNGAQHLGPFAEPYATQTWSLIDSFNARTGKRP